VAALDQALEHAGNLLADLARAEDDIADILTRLASRNGSDLAARRRRLATQASAAARRARDRAQALRQLATTDAATTSPRTGTSGGHRGRPGAAGVGRASAASHNRPAARRTTSGRTGKTR
jgi:hypothetical protein